MRGPICSVCTCAGCRARRAINCQSTLFTIVCLFHKCGRLLQKVWIVIHTHPTDTSAPRRWHILSSIMTAGRWRWYRILHKAPIWHGVLATCARVSKLQAMPWSCLRPSSRGIHVARGIPRTLHAGVSNWQATNAPRRWPCAGCLLAWARLSQVSGWFCRRAPVVCQLLQTAGLGARAAAGTDIHEARERRRRRRIRRSL